MRLFICFILACCFACTNAQISKTDSILDVVGKDISLYNYKQAWRRLHSSKNLFSKTEIAYDIALVDIYKGTYQYLRDDTLKAENKKTLEELANKFLCERVSEIESRYGSQWERLFWLSRIYNQDNDISFRSFVDKCKQAYNKTKFKNDPYYLSIILTYINYAILNREDWSYILFNVPISEIKNSPNHTNLDLAVAYHQMGIAYLHKEISNRKYESNQGFTLGRDGNANVMINIGKEYLDSAKDLYKKCNVRRLSTKYRQQLEADYKLCSWLLKHPKRTNFKPSDTFSTPVCLYSLEAMEDYKPIALELDKLQQDNYDALKQALDFIAKGDYQNAVNCIIDIAPTVIVPNDIILYYYFLVSSLAMYDGDAAVQYLLQYFEKVQFEIIPFCFQGKTEFERQKLSRLMVQTLSQISMKTALMHKGTDAAIIAYNVSQVIKNFEPEVSSYIRKEKENNIFDDFTLQSLRIVKAKEDSLYFGSNNNDDFINNLQLYELNKMLLNSDINTHKVLQQIYNYKKISTTLNQNATLIEYCVYTNLEGSERYSAFILNAETEKPIVIDICAVDDAQSFLSTNTNTINDIYSNDNLYNTFFRKLEPYLMHDTLVVCPVGILENINFDAIYKQGKRLMDEYLIYRYHSGHNFVKSTRTKHQGGNNATLYGGIAYSKEQEKESEYATRHFKLTRGVRSSRNSLQYLQYSAEEIANIKDILNQNGFDVKTYTGLDATEESLIKQDGKAPSILHIATHGYFLSEDTVTQSFFNNFDFYQESKLLHTGLFLANSKDSWLGENTNLDKNDGIITAYEISKLDLSNVSLAVLSACETADGFVDNIEGIQGLQYAFRMAGAGSMLLSLWKIDDAITYLFMKEFYSKLFSTKDIILAYHSALRQIMKEYPDPYDWANFLLILN